MATEVCYFSEQYRNQDTNGILNVGKTSTELKKIKYLNKYKYFKNINEFKSVEYLLHQRKAIAEDIDNYQPNNSPYNLESLYELLDYINDLLRDALGL